ncbi:MAG TPA: helix-turn-helix domain-containing protein [Bacillales bacterium]|nr:helix-turn-helix domain-containing protein [Bacillales bacterium]
MKDGKLTHTRRERRDAAENRQLILDTALRLFEQYSVEQVSMNQIAKEAQIGPGTLYRRYRNKAELCLDLMKDNVDLFFEDVEAYLAENQTKPASERLKGVLGLFIRFRENKAQLLKGVEDPGGNNQAKSVMRSPLYHELHELFRKLFAEISDAGMPEANPVFKADMLLSALRSDGYLFQREVRELSPEEILRQVCLSFGLD